MIWVGIITAVCTNVCTHVHVCPICMKNGFHIISFIWPHIVKIDTELLVGYDWGLKGR